MEAIGAGSAFERDTALFVDDVEPVGPGGVSLLGGVFQVVEQCGDFDLQLAHTGIGHCLAFGSGLRVGINDTLLFVDG